MHAPHPTRPVTGADIERYERDGVVCLRDVFEPAWIERLRDATEIAMREPGPLAEEYASGAGRFFGDIDVSRRHPAFRDFVHGSTAAAIAGALMRSQRVNFFYDQLLVKEPGTTERTPWHQDQPYWAVCGRQVCSIWLPLDEVPRDSAVRYVRGSHRWGAHNPRHFVDDSPYAGTELPELPDIDDPAGGYEFLGWDMRPGDCLVFQAMIVHGAAGNLSPERRRRAWATRWAGDDARYCVRRGETGYPTFETGLKHGDPLDGAHFPVVWRAPGG